MVLGGVRVMGGRFDEARPFLARANEMAASRPDHFVAAVTPVFEAIAELESGRSDDARNLAVTAIATADEYRIAEAPQLASAHSVEARHGRAARPSVDGFVEELTERELSVLRYLPSGLSQREIAGELYVSLNTVKTHCKAIYRKLGVDGRKAAVQAARDHGLL